MKCNVSSDKLFVKQVKFLVESLSKIEEEKDLKREYLRGLRYLKSQYTDKISDDNFFESISEIINNNADIQMIITDDESGQLLSVLSQNYRGLLSNYDPYNVESTLDIGSKFDEIDSTPLELNEKKAIKEDFLNLYFPMSSDARLSFELRFKGNIIQHFFFNEDGGYRINMTNSEMDKSVKDYRNELVEYLDKYVKENFPEKSYDVYKQYSIKSKLKYFKNLLNNGKLSITPIELIKVPAFDLLTDEELKSKLLAYMAYIALTHYDELIANAFEDSIVINHKGLYDDIKEVKYRINLGNRAATTWNDDSKDIDETEQIGSVIRLYMESLNMYDGDRMLPFKMTFSDVKSAIGGIMNLFTSYNVIEKKLNRDFRLESLADLESTLKKSGLEKFYKNFDTIYYNYILNKTIGELIAKTKLDPALLAPLLFTVLAKGADSFFENRYQVKLSINSLWKNIFDMNNEHSLLNRTLNSGGINLDAADLYSFVTTLFVNIENIPMMEYKKDTDKSISTIELKQNTSNSRINSWKYTWAGKYNAENPLSFKTFTIDNFKDSSTTEIHISKSDVVLEVEAKEGGVLVNSKGKLYSLNKEGSVNNSFNEEVLDFLSEVFDTTIDNNYLEIYTGVGGKIKDLIDLAGTILYNYKVGKTISNKLKILKAKDSSKSLKEYYDNEINNYYGSYTPNTMRDSLLPELIGKSIFPTVRRFSLALDIQKGYSGDTTAKDGQGKQISLMGLSSLMSKYMELVYNYNLNDEESILKNFNIYNVFEGASFMRDYAGVEAKKEAKKFSEAEFFAANFLYDFYGELLAVNNGMLSDLRSNSSSESTKFRIMGPVVSDKNKLPKLQFDWNSLVTLPNGDKKKFYELTADEIIEIQNKEFGDYYEGVYKRITQDWLRIQPYISKYIKGAILDFNNDFEIFNDLCKKAGLSPFDVIHSALVDYLAEARINGKSDYDIRITDNFHYIHGSDGEIHNNPSLFHQLNIYGRGVPFKVRNKRTITNPDGTKTILNEKYLPNLNVNTINETPELARERLNHLFISELLQYDINIRFGDKNSNVIDNASFAARLYNKDGWLKGKTIIYGKIKEGTKVIDLYSLNTFKNWNKYKDLLEFYGNNIPENMNINSPKFELLRTLLAINIIHKYNVFRYSQVHDLFVNKYINEGLWLSINIEEVVRLNLINRHPSWKPETIERKTAEYINNLSEEDIKKEKASFGLNADINSSILREIEGENAISDSYIDYNKGIEYIQENLEENDDNAKVFERLNSTGYQLEINPEVERYLALNNWLGESYMLTSVGTFIAHPGNKNASTIYNYEYGNFGLQVKRNVSQTATKHREVQNSLKGIRSKLRVAFVGDEMDSIITFKGDYSEDGVETHNGATWYNGTMVDLDNNSLGADAMGKDKKPFIHAIDPKTGCAIIIKTAGFAVDNTAIQSSEFMSRINKKMNNTIKWTDILKVNGYPDSYFDWTKGFDGNPLNFVSNSLKGWYVQKNGRFYKFFNPNIDSNGNTRVRIQEVDYKGNPISNLILVARFGYINGQFSEIIDTKEGAKNLEGKLIKGNVIFTPINSNWELWNVFGGAYSCHFENTSTGKVLTSVLDNTSFLMVNYVMNHTGKIKNNNIPVVSQSNVLQIIKEALIDMIPTMEAGKFGATNINSTDLLENDDYVPSYMEVFSDDFGEQLDAEHSAEGGHVSLMTQVINALGARGYSKQDAEECYEALENLAEQAFEDAFDALLGINNNISGYDLINFKIQIANIMLQTFKNSSISDGNILTALSQGLKKFLNFTNVSLLEGVFPVSSPLIFAKAFSKLASSLEKASVRLKFEGGMLVLNPSNSIFKLINGKFANKVSYQEALRLLINSLNNPLKQASEIKIGRNYFIINNEIGLFVPKLVDSIDDFNEVKEALLSGAHVFEAFLDEIVVSQDTTDISGKTLKSNYTGKPLGRELATYDCVVGRLNSDETYSMYELDAVKHLFSWNNKTKSFKTPLHREQTNLESLWNEYQSGNTSILEVLLNELQKYGIKEINPDLMHSYLERAFLDTLNTISQGIGNNVIINGERITIDKSKTTVSPYEAILPMIYKTSFGLKNNDTVGDIENDKYFFVKRFIENSTSKFYTLDENEYNVDGDEFDFELKRTSGDHIYIVHPNKNTLGEAVTIDYEVIGDNLYRVRNGVKLYLLPAIKDTEGKLIPNCKILKLDNGVEVIETEDFLSILEQGDYNSISFGNFEDSEDYVLDILEQLELSTNKTAQNKVKYILNAVSEKTNTNREGLQKGVHLYTDSIGRNKKLTASYLKAPERFNSISEIFADEAGRNALEHHELYTLDAKNQQTKLIELALIITKGTEELLQEFLSKNYYMKHIIDFGLEQHTSFLTSLEAVVSRTPAQSHLSFMAMKIAGFDNNVVNSIYVNRMLLYLQGSDYDIDKDNLLGLKFYNGKLVVWSPYYDLTSKERAVASESLPFPSGKSLLINEDFEKIPFDVLEKDYNKIENIREFLDNNGNIISVKGYAFVDNNGNVITLHEVSKGLWYIEQRLNENGLSQNTYLLQHAVVKNLPKKAKIIFNDALDSNVFKINNETLEGIDKNADLLLYLSSLDLTQTNNKFDNLKDLGKAIRVLTKMREVSSLFADIKKIVDAHNCFFLKKDGTRNKAKDRMKRDALYNFISIKTKNISKDPINLIQGLSGIDVATDVVKNLVKPGKFFDSENPNIKLDRLSAMPITSDNRSILARMHQLVLTLTGKENVGIVASAMKVFEAMSHHYNKVLSEGTLEEQKRLLSKIKIMGKSLPLVANSYTKNRDTLLSAKIEEAYDLVDNYKDAFIMMSALLSLATDNAKDPTLSKLNATPETIGCYTAGLVLGLSVSDVAELLISDTGILLANMVKSNVFNPRNNLFNHLSDAIRFIRDVPKCPEHINLKEFLEMFGLWKPKDKKDVPNVEEILRYKGNRNKFKLMAAFLLHTDTFKLETDIEKIAKKGLENIKDDPRYWKWNEEDVEKYNNRNKLSDKEKKKIEDRYSDYLDLKELKESYEAYMDDPESTKAERASKEINNILLLNEKNSTDESKLKIKALMQSTLGMKEYLESVFEWINYNDIVDKDKIIKNGAKYKILGEIRKLNSFNEEMGALRSVLKLNLGLPNSVQEQHNWINNFKGILSKAALRQNRKIKEESNSPLSKFFNNYGSLDLDLNRFLNDAQYQKDAVDAYESTKVGVNILDVMLNIPHYRGYMKTMNLLYEGSKAVSVVYKTLSKIVKDILPKLNLKTAEQREKFFKTLNPIIFERVNNNFLWLEQAEYEIPRFRLDNGELIELRDENGKLLFETIRLGTPETNAKFKDYCLHYVYPYLKTNYPDNAFVLAITTRTYGYNLDHLISVNIAKRWAYDTTNPNENVQFNLIKKDLMELNGIGGIVRALFYYNLIAYNGLPGNLSLTDLFEDFLIYDNNKVISDYNKYITYLDIANEELFTEKDNEYLLRVLAPEVFTGENVKGLSYIWVTNPENNKKILMRYVGTMSEEELELYGIQLDNENPEEDFYYNDDEYSDYSAYTGYKTLGLIKTKWLKNEWIEEDSLNNTSDSKKFVFGKETLLNPEVIFDTFNDKYKKKHISELAPDLKNKILKLQSKNITLSINGEFITLKDYIDLVKDKKWSAEDVFNAFLFVSRKSRNHTYDVLINSRLKYQLEFMLNNDKNSC